MHCARSSRCSTLFDLFGSSAKTSLSFVLSRCGMLFRNGRKLEIKAMRPTVGSPTNECDTWPKLPCYFDSSLMPHFLFFRAGPPLIRSDPSRGTYLLQTITDLNLTMNHVFLTVGFIYKKLITLPLNQGIG